MELIRRWTGRIDRLNEMVGRAVSWLTLGIVLVTCAVVLGRYGFGWGRVWLQESYVWMHGIVFMLGAGYTLLHEGHVRVDIVYRPAGRRYRAIVDLLGSLLLLLPMIVAVLWLATPYVIESWQRLESSRETDGLPGIFLLKSVILLFCVLVGLQGLSLAGKAFLALAGQPDLYDRHGGAAEG
jgi:TRAP-type mannitol/chloroaromatic compound transport system permease small subunit